jgi:thioredoxin reductase (NADPH)
MPEIQNSQPAPASDEVRDCLVIGGGPAGLTAAIYLARFHLSVTVADAGGSRAGLIPVSHNHAGFPEGISGVDLLRRMREQSAAYGAQHRNGEVRNLEAVEGGYIAKMDGSALRARAVLLATGVVNRRPEMIDEGSHAQALADGRLRYCPICDGYEVTDRRVAVLGTGERGCKEALFLRSYTADLTLIAPSGPHQLSDEQSASLFDAGIHVVGPCRAIRLAERRIIAEVGQTHLAFDSLYPALGSISRSELGAQLGAQVSEEGCLMVDTHQRTSVPGLYAAGDVVLGLDQISHAMGEGGVAATTIRNDLALQTPLRR